MALIVWKFRIETVQKQDNHIARACQAAEWSNSQIPTQNWLAAGSR